MRGDPKRAAIIMSGLFCTRDSGKEGIPARKKFQSEQSSRRQNCRNRSTTDQIETRPSRGICGILWRAVTLQTRHTPYAPTTLDRACLTASSSERFATCKSICLSVKICAGMCRGDSQRIELWCLECALHSVWSRLARSSGGIFLH
jgi:hypothetical protein